jgi:hypothetical protein
VPYALALLSDLDVGPISIFVAAVQNDPNKPAPAMGNGPDGLVMACPAEAAI